jgi:hypothetical protein
MRTPETILKSEDISVVDDVSTDVVLESVGELEGQNVEVRDLGGGYVEINGYVFQEDWDEIDPPGSEDEPEFSHEEVVAGIRNLAKELKSNKC